MPKWKFERENLNYREDRYCKNCINSRGLSVMICDIMYVKDNVVSPYGTCNGFREITIWEEVQ